MKLFLSFFLILSSSIYAQSGTGPYKSESKANIAQKIVHLLDNSSVGAIQTVLGASHILVFGILNPIMGENFGLGFHNNNKGSEVSQIIVKTDAINTGAYSLGLFQVGDQAHAHEGGHSVASASLGPFYLPTVALSYLFEGHGKSFIENWADMEKGPASFLDTAKAEIGLGSTYFNGKQAHVVVFKFNIEQRQINEYKNLVSDKIFQWLNTEIIAPWIENTHQETPPLFVEFDLLRKRLNLIVDNLPFYLRGNHQLRQSFLSEQKYLSLENNPALKQVHIKALDWSLKYGLHYNLGKTFSITPRIGIGAGLGLMSDRGTDYKTFMFQDQYNFAASFKFNAALDINLWNYATLTGEFEKEFFTNGITKTSFTGNLHNGFRDPFNNLGFIQFLDIGAGMRTDIWETPTEKTTWTQWNATLGIRF